MTYKLYTAIVDLNLNPMCKVRTTYIKKGNNYHSNNGSILSEYHFNVLLNEQEEIKKLDDCTHYNYQVK